jgi:hypothetical protein
MGFCRGHHPREGTHVGHAADNAKTFEPLDFGLSAEPPPVAPGSFGPVTYLKVVA